ncbi:MAG: hypothetical protein PHX43_05225 [Alphaproteobacteria bacterium]|nr:hypothetical protein [Alphaproteobacteria bacterium]
MKEQIKAGWKKVKTWVVNHKKAVILGTAGLVAGAIGVAISAARKEELSHEEEGQKILEALEANLEDTYDEDEYKDVDRYTISKDVMDLLPAGTYDVFDGYENSRVDYVVEGKESMET